MTRFIFLLLMLSVCVGCGSSNDPQALAERSETDLTKLMTNAKKIKASVEKTKREASEQVLLCDAVLAKVNTLLGHAPQPVIPVIPVIPIVPSPPSPVPTPVTPPGPLPPVPSPLPPSPSVPVGPVDGRFGVAIAVWKIASAVESPDRVQEASDLGDVFAGIAKDVRDKKLEGTLLDPQWHRISMALTARNKPVIAKHFEAWDSPATQLGKKIGLFYKEGKLQSNEDWADLLDEIALGLRFRSK